MTITTEAVYENGMLKLERALPLAENERVEVTVRSKDLPKRDTQQAEAAARSSFGILGWKGDHETLQRLLDEADEPEERA
jgi:predicted DNA-binding antitoxin AbrB/MazE fold protein